MHFSENLAEIQWLFRRILFEEKCYENVSAYYYDIPFEGILARHVTKRNKFSFGEQEMRRWWRDRDYIGFIPEKSITSDLSLLETVDMICSSMS